MSVPTAAKDLMPAKGQLCQVDVDGKPCGKRVQAKGMCMSHYQRERRAKAKAKAPTPPPPEKQMARARGARYTEQQVEAGLLAIIMHGGAINRAAETTGISRSTLSDWQLQYAARYAELRREKGPELERIAVDGLLQFAIAAESAKLLALEKTVEQLESDEGAKDPGAVLRNIATAQGISVTKVMELTGRPTAQNAGMRTARELLEGLARLGAVVNSTAEEVHDQPALDSGVTETVVAVADSEQEGASH